MVQERERQCQSEKCGMEIDKEKDRWVIGKRVSTNGVIGPIYF